MALAGRDDMMLEPVLRLLLAYVADPRFGELACDLAGIVIGMCVSFVDPGPHSLTPHSEMYSPVIGQSPLVDTLFQRLHTKLKGELKFQKELVRLRGAVDMVMATSALQRV
jgi:U3 small nucleolar RNA-associated protein 15